MTAILKYNEPKSFMLEATCPRCKRPMRLATIEPAASSGDNKISFDCRCGVVHTRVGTGVAGHPAGKQELGNRPAPGAL